jgi:L,D-peptidoglycan transpeptidase YkuD (ErfK/YbiS/YcfS/YnhG family)
MRLRSATFGIALMTLLAQCGPPACAPAPTCGPLPDGVPADAGQVVVVTSSGSNASVDLLVNEGGGWQCVAGGMPARVGVNGVRPLAERRSGDGTTPGGIFGLGVMTDANGQPFNFFGNGTNPGLGGWHHVEYGDCWEETPGDPAYNTLVSRPPGQCVGAEDEYLPASPGAYSRAALIDANMGPDRSGDQPGEPALAAAIFLHRFSYVNGGSSGPTKPTSGCVSLSAADLETVLMRLWPGQAYFVIR